MAVQGSTPGGALQRVRLCFSFVLTGVGHCGPGINSGVMLFRNVQWSRDILEEIAELGRIPEPGLESVLMEELTSPEYTYDPGLRDQNALSYLLKRDWQKNMPHTQLVNRQYCLNCYWRDLLELGTLTSDDTRVRLCPPPRQSKCVNSVLLLSSWTDATRLLWCPSVLRDTCKSSFVLVVLFLSSWEKWNLSVSFFFCPPGQT